MWSVPDVKHVSGTYLDFVGGPSWTRTSDQRIMRADIQRKPLGFQGVTSTKYRCVAFCVVDLM